MNNRNSFLRVLEDRRRMTGGRRQGTSREGTQENVRSRSRSRGGVFSLHSHRVTDGWGWGDDVKQCPRGGTCCLDRQRNNLCFGTYTAGPGWSGMETDEVVCILGPATQESHQLCNQGKGEKGRLSVSLPRGCGCVGCVSGLHVLCRCVWSCICSELRVAYY